jgi:hypothetical protein
MVDDKTPAPDAAGTTTTTYTVPPPAGGTPAPIGFLTRSPMTITCPHCAVTAVTRPRSQIDCVTVLIVVLLLLLFWPLFWLPFLIPVSTNECCSNERLCSLHCLSICGRRLETNRKRRVLPPLIYQILTICIRLFDTVLQVDGAVLRFV